MSQPQTTVEVAGRAMAEAVFGAERLAVIRELVAKDATDAELAVFAEVCKRTGLDPFARQIYAIKRKVRENGAYVERLTIQISIDGARLAAERSGKYLGQTPPQWCGPDLVWRDVWLDDEPPAAARIGVWKAGAREPTYAVARFRSYVQTFNKDGRQQTAGLWVSMPDVMVAKCAESLALRKAFPAELSGLYTTEEMEQADSPPIEVTATHAPPMRQSQAIPPVQREPPEDGRSEETRQRARFWARATELGYATKSAVHQALGLEPQAGALAEWIAAGHTWEEAQARIEDAAAEQPPLVEMEPERPHGDPVDTRAGR